MVKSTETSVTMVIVIFFSFGVSVTSRYLFILSYLSIFKSCIKRTCLFYFFINSYLCSGYTSECHLSIRDSRVQNRYVLSHSLESLYHFFVTTIPAVQ